MTRQEQMELAAVHRVAESLAQVGIAINRLCEVLEKQESFRQHVDGQFQVVIKEQGE
jgi:hypothetical protein